MASFIGYNTLPSETSGTFFSHMPINNFVLNCIISTRVLLRYSLN